MSNLALSNSRPTGHVHCSYGCPRPKALSLRRRVCVVRRYDPGRAQPRMAVVCKYASYRPSSKPQRRESEIKDRNRARLGVYINEEINVREVRLIDEEREMLGIFPTSDALRKAEEQGVDLILVSANASPPVCQLIEWGKYKFQLEKQDKEKRRKQRQARVELKELKMRPGTDTHDYNVRLRKAVEEIGKGNRIRLVCMFRGREHQFHQQGYQLFERFLADLGESAAVEKKPKMEGKFLVMVIGPARS